MSALPTSDDSQKYNPGQEPPGDFPQQHQPGPLNYVQQQPGAPLANFAQQPGPPGVSFSNLVIRGIGAKWECLEKIILKQFVQIAKQMYLAAGIVLLLRNELLLSF